MHHVTRRFIAAAATLIFLLKPDAAQAQATMTITGRVTSNGQPLGGTQVGIVELSAGAITDQQGRYSFTIDPARASKPVSLLARTIGYRPIRRSITLTAGRSEQNFELEKDVLNLETVVTTGVSEATSQKKTTFAVAAVDDDGQLDRPRPPVLVQRLERGAHGSAGEEHVVHDNHRLAVDVGRQIGGVNHHDPLPV